MAKRRRDSASEVSDKAAVGETSAEKTPRTVESAPAHVHAHVPKEETGWHAEKKPVKAEEVDLEASRTPENRKPRKPVPQDIKLSARQYIRVRKYPWRRCAGFVSDMKRQFGNASKTRPEWDQLWATFWARPVR